MIQLKVAKLTCRACINTITAAIENLDPTAEVMDTSENEITKAIASIGYPAS